MQILQGCSDCEQAFHNWMERDILFAERIREQCLELDDFFLVTDGTQTIADLESWIRNCWQLFH